LVKDAKLPPILLSYTATDTGSNSFHLNGRLFPPKGGR
jgi:hypothetical protein